MKYQTIKHLKTKAKLIALSESFTEAVAKIPAPAVFRELTYIGGFPVFTSEGHTYSIQGFVERLGVMCSLPEEDVKQYRN